MRGIKVISSLLKTGGASDNTCWTRRQNKALSQNGRVKSFLIQADIGVFPMSNNLLFVGLPTFPFGACSLGTSRQLIPVWPEPYRDGTYAAVSDYAVSCLINHQDALKSKGALRPYAWLEYTTSIETTGVNDFPIALENSSICHHHLHLALTAMHKAPHPVNQLFFTAQRRHKN